MLLAPSNNCNFIVFNSCIDLHLGFQTSVQCLLGDALVVQGLCWEPDSGVELDQLGPGVVREAEQGCVGGEALQYSSRQIRGEEYTPLPCEELNKIRQQILDFTF